MTVPHSDGDDDTLPVPVAPKPFAVLAPVAAIQDKRPIRPAGQSPGASVRLDPEASG
ncbi:hypothetical protein [Actinacidiphila oryziradicis]|uniref:hypothetical protein n=1 Tax=Actinacidiphila oryziradicis TaxID=2571141 RepID=UPI00145D5090|nr:hypothetical protein [Actinacidiphila oryziradicis]